MSTPKIARTVVPLKARQTQPVTLADVTVTWRIGDVERTATGRQIARLLTEAFERVPSGITQDDIWPERLRGLSWLVFPDAGDSIYETEGRAFVSDTLLSAACQIGAMLDSEEWPGKFQVQIQPGSGRSLAAAESVVAGR